MSPLLAVAFGTLPQWLTVAGVVGIAVALRGGQIGPAVGYLREANAALVEENRDLKTQLGALRAEVSALRERTDLGPIQTAVLEHMGHHEERAQGRFERTCIILELIAERLGAEQNHDAPTSRERLR